MAKKCFRIGIDFDDVLAATAEHAVQLYNKKYGTQLTLDNWYNLDSLSPWGVATVPEITRRVKELLYSQGEAIPVKDSQRVIKKLKDDGHSLFIITGRPESVRAQTLDFLMNNYKDTFNDSSLYFTDHFCQIGERTEKSDVCKRLNLTHFIDDQIEHVNSVNSEGIRTILFSDNYAWNRTGYGKRVARCSSWRQIEKFFDEEQR